MRDGFGDGWKREVPGDAGVVVGEWRWWDSFGDCCGLGDCCDGSRGGGRVVSNRRWREGFGDC